MAASAALLALALNGALAVPRASSDNAVTVTVDWSSEKVVTHTAATVEVDVMPFLGRADWGGPFNAYYEALANLGSEFVRYAPWFPNPRVVVAELKPSDCTKTKPATNWNSTYFDGIMRDFMAAVCGPDAVSGACKLSVVQQLSTMPSWMYKGGYCQDPDGCLPDYPWNTTDPFSAYAGGSALVDETCGQMARYMGRLVGHYTAGGHHDECGHWHPSGFNYTWYGLSVLNEDEHHISPDDGTAYTTCYDAIMAEVHKVNPTIVGVGPEIAGTSGHATEYMMHFLDPANHKGYQGVGANVAPKVSSFHWGSSASAPADSPAGGEGFLNDWEKSLNDPDGTMQKVQAYKKKTGQKTEMVLNEYIPFVGDWCDVTNKELAPGGKCPSWQDPKTAGGNPDLRKAAGLGINRKTWSWNAAAAVFAYGYGTLAELQYKYVGQDQLIGGTWPDNEPAVSCMDWQTGEVNAKYWVINLLAMTVGDSGEKSIKTSKISDTTPPAPPPPGPAVGTTKAGNCGGTGYEPLATCESGPGSGALNTTAEGIKSLAECVAKVKSCKNANYVSFSLAEDHQDCSWYSHCDWKELSKPGGNYMSEVVTGKDSGGGGADGPPIYAMPYTKDGKKGMLLVNKKSVGAEVTIAGATGGQATIVEVNTDPSCSDPGFEPQVRRPVSAEGKLSLGPFGVAVVTELM